MATYNLTMLDNKLLKYGISSFNGQEKNQLINQICNREGKIAYEVDMDYLFEYHKRIKIQNLNETCDKKIEEGFTSSNGNVYRTNRDDQLNFIGKMTQIIKNKETVNEIKTVSWKTMNNGYFEHSVDDWSNVYDEGIEHKENNLFRYETLKQRVQNAETDDDIVNITWESDINE